jgi:hypothetical protein
MRIRQLLKVVKDLNGVPYPGVVEPPSETSGVSADYHNPSLNLRVRSNSALVPAKYVTYNKVVYILLQHHNEPHWKTFKMLRCDAEVSISEIVTQIEPITGLPETIGSGTPLILWASEAMVLRERPDYVTRIAESKRTYVIDRKVNEGSTIDDKVVKRVEPVLGAWYIEAQ